MPDDFDFKDELFEEDDEMPKYVKNKGSNVDTRRKIEEILEERRLRRELNDFDSF